jgi:hypothetical protein
MQARERLIELSTQSGSVSKLLGQLVALHQAGAEVL